ncbi:MAG TPA: translocase [Polyangia bacterium]|nr:translocase [Polyangia bacterium]
MAISTEKPTALGRLVRLFGDVRVGEVASVLLLSLNGFLLLTAYYVLKVVREPLILVGGGGAEIKSYATGAQALLLILVVKANDGLAKRFPRMGLVAMFTLFSAGCLVLFCVLSLLSVPIGIPFYLWVGMFSVTLIAQFWGFAADVYTADQGKRLFAIVGIGGSLGGVVGADVAQRLLVPLGPSLMMLVAAAIVLVYLFVMYVVHRRELRSGAHPAEQPIVEASQPIGERGGFSLVLHDRYLLLIGGLTLLLNWVNTTGEYLLDRTLLEITAPETAAHAVDFKTVQQFIGAFKAEYFFWVNLAALLMQLFVASRVLKYLGVRGALYILPLLAITTYSSMVLVPLVAVVALAKVAENSVNYSIQNTTKQALYLVTSREAKYKAKTVIDSFLQRAGDVITAGLVWGGIRLHLSTRQFVVMVMAAIAGWLALVVAIGREHRVREAALQRTAPAPPARVG